MIRLAALIIVLATVAVLVLRAIDEPAERAVMASTVPATQAAEKPLRPDPAAPAPSIASTMPPEPPADRTEPPALHVDAWAAVSPLQGRHALLDPGRAFDAARAAAEAGDADALLDLAFAVENCHAAANFPTRAALDAFVRTRPNADPQEVEKLAALIPTCRRMAEAAPEGMRLEAWSRSLRERAAGAGQPLARFLGIDLSPPTQDAYEAAAGALSAAVATESPFAWREAAEFLLAFPSPVRDDPYHVEPSAWLLLSCRADAVCDAPRLEAQIAEVQLPVYAESILRRAEALRTAVDAGKPFDLHTGWQAPPPDRPRT